MVKLPRQLHLFDFLLKEVRLEAKSAKCAFWALRLFERQGEYYISKESGGNEKVLDRRHWPQKSYESAMKTFDKKVREKLNPNRKSKRRYEIKYKYECKINRRQKRR